MAGRLVDGHKRECHKCPHNGMGDPICLRCPGPAEGSYKGISYVYLDNMTAPEELIETARADRGRGQEPSTGGVTPLGEDLEDEMRKVIAGFMQLEDFEMVILRHKFLGESDGETARAAGVARAEVVKILCTVSRKCPEVARTVERMRAAGYAPPKRQNRVKCKRFNGWRAV